MIRLKELKLVFGGTETRTDGTGWTDGRGSRNSYLDVYFKLHGIDFINLSEPQPCAGLETAHIISISYFMEL